MKLFRISTLAALAFAVASGTGLFVVSQRVQRAEYKLADLRHDKTVDEHSVRVLRAEWDYLNRPERLEVLARRYLGMEPPDLSSITGNPADLLPKAADAASADHAVAHKASPHVKPQPAVYRLHAKPDRDGFSTLIRTLSDDGEGGQ